MFCAPEFVFDDTEGVRSCFPVLRARTRVRRQGRRIPFSSFVLPDSFSAVPRASLPVFTFCGLGLVLGGSEGVRSRFHVLRARTRFQRYRGRRVPFACFACPDSFLVVPWASGPVVMFCAPGLDFGGTEGVPFLFHVLRFRTRVRPYRGGRVPFSCFAHPYTFSAVPRASGLIFMFCALELVFDGTGGVMSRFLVLRARTHFRRFQGLRIPFSCFARRIRFRRYQGCHVPISSFVLPDPFSCFALLGSFSVVPRASGPDFMFCALGLVFGDAECVGSRFHVLRSRNCFRRYRGRLVPISCFAHPDTFSAVPGCRRCPIFLFCAPRLIFDGTEGVGSHFHVLPTRTRFRWYRGRLVPISCFAPRLVFDGTKGVGSRFHVLCSRIHFRRYRGRRVPFHVLHSSSRFRRYQGRLVPFSCFACPNSFSAVWRASSPVFMFCVPRLIFDGTNGVGSHFSILRARTRVRRYRGRRIPFSSFALPDSFSAVPRASVPVFMFYAPGLVLGGFEDVRSRFHVLRARTHFWRYRGRRVPFSCFVRRDSFSVVPWASGPIVMFCAPGLDFDGTEVVPSRFHVLCFRTRFRPYRGGRVPFSYFALLNSFSAVSGASSPVFLFCAPGLVFGGSKVVVSRFHILRSRTRFRRYRGRRVPFHLLRTQIRFRRYQGRRVPFSNFVLPDSFSAVWGGVWSQFHV
jgi:hypothetical protein